MFYSLKIDFPKNTGQRFVLTAKYLRNQTPVMGRDITPYESKTGLLPQLSHLCRIG